MIVALGATAHVGKDHLGDHLRDALGARTAKLSAPVKRDVVEMLRRRDLVDAARQISPVAGLEDPGIKEIVRPILEAYGRAIHDLDPMLLPRLLEATEPFAHHRAGGLCVITDLRYPEEADWVHSEGGLVVVIDRPGKGPINATEAEFAPRVRAVADVILRNDGGRGFVRRGEALVRRHWGGFPAERAAPALAPEPAALALAKA